MTQHEPQFNIVPNNILARIERNKRRLAADTANYARVEAHDRLLTGRLTDQNQKAAAFRNIESLCRKANRIGITAEDKRLARAAIRRLEECFEV